jgi:hypothetical protein
MAERLSRSWIVAALMPALSLALILTAITNPSAARAANGTCTFSEGWTCIYSGNSWPSGVKLWFEAAGGNNQRNWLANWGHDAYGGSVYKCSGFKSFDGGEIPQGCSNSGPSYVSIPSWRRPGWIYVVQHAGAPRNISGRGLH